MCGICGIIDYSSGSKVKEALIRRMNSQLRHRGPDDEGVYVSLGSPAVGLGHRRLSIIDLTVSGHQPMPNEDRTVWIVLNGEIYNYPELRKELEDKGHIFQSHTDTETVLHLYEEYGKECVSFLRGMFAFAIWDEKEQQLLLARDRLGKKPLIYSRTSSGIVFASEFLALLESGLISKEINYQAVHQYLTSGYVPAPSTIYNNVFKLPPAHRLIFKNKEVLIERYWQLDYLPKLKISEEDACLETMRLLRESVKVRLYSDVPLGAFLSGGIDSSTVVALMSELSTDSIKTFSIGFEEKDYNELKYSRKIAERFHTDHHELIVKPDALKILPLLVERYGEPYADSSCIPTYYVAEETKRFVTVALNGDGGDELFAGYERYQAMLIAENFEKLPYLAKAVIKKLSRLLPDSVDARNRLRRARRFIDGAMLPFNKRYEKWVGIFSEQTREQIYSDDFRGRIKNLDTLNFISNFFADNQKYSLLDNLLNTDVNTNLPNDLLVKVDITCMANSLEARAPFLDHKLIEFGARLPVEYKIKGTVKKYILKKAISDLIPRSNVYRRKMGFGVPVGMWLRGELRDFLRETLLSRESLNRGYFKPMEIKRMLDMHINGKQDYTLQIWALLMLELWHQRFID